MQKLYQTLFIEHDLRFVALAIGVCALASLTGTAIAQYSMQTEGTQQRRWLLLAGFVTGLGVWSTHVTAMLGYRADLDIHFDLAITAVALLLVIAVTIFGGLVALGDKDRGLLGGAIVGASIAIAYFMDINALRFAGVIVHDRVTTIIAVTGGVGLAAWTGHILAQRRDQIFAWPAAIVLFSAIIAPHFIAMSGVTIVPGTAPETRGWLASVDQLAIIVVAAFLLMLTTAVAYTWHSQSLSRATAQEQRRLIQALETLRETRDHHRAFIELNPQIAWVAAPNGMITEIAPLWGELVGLPREASYGEGWASVVHPDDLPGASIIWRGAIEAEDGDRADVRYRVRLKDGSYRWFRARARPRHDADGTLIAWYGSLEDIHEQVLNENALRASEERYRLATRATSDVIWEASVEEAQSTWAGAHHRVLGYPELEHPTPRSWWFDRIHPDDRDLVVTKQTAAIEAGADFMQDEYRFLKATGEWIDVRTQCIIVRDDNGKATRLVGSMQDITRQKKTEAQLHWAAHHDPLTALPNRTLYRQRMHAAVDAARRSGRKVAVILLDLNNFKGLNDTLGHAAGDRVLEETARRLLANLPETSTIARLGGDEFAIVLPDMVDEDGYAAHMTKVSASLAEPFGLGDQRMPVSFSAGVALWPRDGDDEADILIAADLALYAAKDEMPGTITEFTPSLKGASERRSNMLALARQALAEDRIVPFYQPKIDLQTGHIMGWEALLRIRDAQGEILPPSQIAAAFGDSEVAVQLTDRMFDRVFADLAVWREKGADPGRIAVNASAADFRKSGFADRLQAHAGAHGQSLSSIDIEVTETVLIGQRGPEVSRMLRELRALGVMVALDDFGTGYASLTHLQEFPVDVIKIDRSFIKRIDEDDPKATAVIDAVLQMANRLGMQTVAEGIETVEQARYLRARRCTIGQGFLFDRPLPASAVPGALAGPGRQWEFMRLQNGQGAA